MLGLEDTGGVTSSSLGTTLPVQGGRTRPQVPLLLLLDTSQGSVVSAETLRFRLSQPTTNFVLDSSLALF